MKKYTTTAWIITYNGEKYIKEQLESILNQTIRPDEIVISDDCSNDNTVEIIKETLGNSNVPYVLNVNRTNLGIVKNCVESLHFCNGEILFISDQDNVWDSRFIESFLSKFESDENLDYVFCNGYVTDENLKVLRDVYDDEFMNKSKNQFLLDAINKKGFPHGFSIACKKSFRERIMPDMFAGDEWCALCAGATGNIGSINEKLVYFRRHESSFSRSEGGGVKKGYWFMITHYDFGRWFIWPFTKRDAYQRYLELFGDTLDSEVKEIVVKHKDFEAELESLKSLGWLSRLKKLCNLSRTKEYEMYRGNRNTFYLDFLYLFIHLNIK